jgi:beta-N-acetylhexosaminidase
MALGADNLPYDAWMTGLLLGRELAAVGVNMNFAPTIDVFVDPKADVIGPRAFMADPQMTGIMGLSFARGHEETGVISTAKHFPGHGDTEQDSHGTLPRVTADLETLMARDLVPYRIMIAGGVPAIMAGHLAFPSITGNEIPATLSKALLTGLLRDKLGFEGVAITDDLFMRGARTDGAPLHEVCYRSLRAGRRYSPGIPGRR